MNGAHSARAGTRTLTRTRVRTQGWESGLLPCLRCETWGNHGGGNR